MKQKFKKITINKKHLKKMTKIQIKIFQKIIFQFFDVYIILSWLGNIPVWILFLSSVDCFKSIKRYPWGFEVASIKLSIKNFELHLIPWIEKNDEIICIQTYISSIFSLGEDILCNKKYSSVLVMRSNSKYAFWH